MNSIELACLSRVRVLVLARIVEAGGTLRPAQLRRAIEPILPDLLEQLQPADRRSAKSTAVRSGRLPTVDTCNVPRRKRRA